MPPVQERQVPEGVARKGTSAAQEGAQGHRDIGAKENQGRYPVVTPAPPSRPEERRIGGSTADHNVDSGVGEQRPYPEGADRPGEDTHSEDARGRGEPSVRGDKRGPQDARQRQHCGRDGLQWPHHEVHPQQGDLSMGSQRLARQTSTRGDQHGGTEGGAQQRAKGPHRRQNHPRAGPRLRFRANHPIDQPTGEYLQKQQSPRGKQHPEGVVARESPGALKMGEHRHRWLAHADG